MSEKREKVISCRFRGEELDQIEKMAHDRDLAPSRLVQDLALKKLEEELLGSNLPVSTAYFDSRLEELELYLGEKLDNLQNSRDLDQTSKKKPENRYSVGSELSANQLSKRLNCSLRTLKKWRQEDLQTLEENTGVRDPDHLVWSWDEKKQLYFCKSE